MKKRNIEVELGGQKRLLKLNLNTMTEFEVATGRSAKDLGVMLKSEISMGLLRTLIWSLLSDCDPAPTQREVGSWIDMETLPLISEKIVELLTGKESDPRSLAPFVPTPEAVVERMLDVARLQPGELLADVGAGDGRVLRAARARGARAVGWELDPERAELCRLVPNVVVINGDAATDGGDAIWPEIDVLFLYLLTPSNEKLKQKIETSLKLGARVVSHDFSMAGWTPYCTEIMSIDGIHHTIYAWEIGKHRDAERSAA